MLKRIVPKPELKYFNVLDGGPVLSTNAHVVFSDWRDAFKIPQGSGLGNRLGDSVWLKMVEFVFEIQANGGCQRERTLTSGGAAGFGNVVDQANYDQAVAVRIVDTNMDVNTNTPLQSLEFIGSTQATAPDGPSGYYLSLDRMVLKEQKRHVYWDKKYVHSKGVMYNGGDYAPTSTTGAPFGLSTPLYQVGTHRIVIKFPGRGRKLQFDSNVTEVPVSMPVMWLVGKNATGANNPFLRTQSCRVWFTDP